MTFFNRIGQKPSYALTAQISKKRTLKVSQLLSRSPLWRASAEHAGAIT